MQKDEVFQAWQANQKLQAQAEAEADEQWLFDIVNSVLNNFDTPVLSAKAKSFVSCVFK